MSATGDKQHKPCAPGSLAVALLFEADTAVTLYVYRE